VRGKRCGAERGAGRQLEREIRRIALVGVLVLSARFSPSRSLGWLAFNCRSLQTSVGQRYLSPFRPFLSGCLSLSRFHKMDSPQDTPSTDHHDDQQAKSSYVVHILPSPFRLITPFLPLPSGKTPVVRGARACTVCRAAKVCVFAIRYRKFVPHQLPYR
jgi:hypothetical protein